MQNLIANMVLREVSTNEAATITMMAVPVPAQQTVSDTFGQILSGILPLFLLIIWILPVYNTVFLIVKEKESRSKESMRMMGMTDTAYWLSWFVYYTIINTIISLIAWGVLCINVIAYSSPGYVFIYFWLFGESIFGQIVVLQALFNSSKYAGIVSTLLYFIGSFFNFPIASDTASGSLKAVLSLIP